MKRIFGLIIVFSLLFANVSFAQEEGVQKYRPGNSAKLFPINSAPSELQSKVSLFFKDLIRSEVSKAYERLLENSPLLKKEQDLQNLVKQTTRSMEIYGAVKGFEGVDSEIVTESMVKMRYLGLHGKYPMRWIFTFYKSPELGWLLINIKFDDMSEYFFQQD